MGPKGAVTSASTSSPEPASASSPTPLRASRK
jgi:hypothetical protein